MTEVHYNTPGRDSEQEWIEIANLGNETLELSEYKLGDEESIWGGEGMFRFPENSIIDSGQVVVVAQSATGFRNLYGRDPDYELVGTIPQVPDMRRYDLWSSGDLALANDGDELLLLDGQNRIVDSINYGEKRTFFTPAIADVYSGQSIERVPATCDTNTAADWQPQRFPTPGQLQLEGECHTPVEFDVDDSNLLTIGQIQGVGDVSPFIHQKVEFRGVITGSYEDQNEMGIIYYTLFVQDVSGDEDDDTKTSDGIAVFLGRSKPEFPPGSIVQIKGIVTEFFGLTEIDDDELEITLIAEDGQVPIPELIHLPDNKTTISAYFETLEGALVTLPQPVSVIGPTHVGCGFVVAEPAAAGQLLPIRREEDLPQPVISVLHHSDVSCEDIPQLKVADQVTGLRGPLIYHFDQFKIVQQDIDQVNVVPAEWPEPLRTIPVSETEIAVATYNLENYFDEVRQLEDGVEPIASAEELRIKRRKIAYTITESMNCPAILAVQEIENQELLQDLVEETHVRCGFEYEINHRDSVDSRGLDVALLSNPQHVRIKSVHLRQGCTTIETTIQDPNIHCPPGENPLFGRPPLQVDMFINGEAYTIFVNHFKSKRGGARETEARRLEQAGHVFQLVNNIVAEDPNARVIVLGDMNDFELSPTILRLQQEEILVNSLWRVPIEQRYSFIFDGHSQLIDTILVTRAVESGVTRAEILHNNARYPAGLADDTSPARIQFRSSDHDIPIIYINQELPANDAPRLPATTSPVSSENPLVESTTPREPKIEEKQRSSPEAAIWIAGTIFLFVLAIPIIYLVNRKG
ncbi:MAG: lamin tail domain-containing protein [Candidatus Promineifilaceae bacterium]|nr:lamin tail domain-containing protein [Candidatus Promineifilaceae bacterium]